MPVSSPENIRYEESGAADLRREVSREITKRLAEAWFARHHWSLDRLPVAERQAVGDLRAFLLAARQEVFQPERFADRRSKLDQWLFSLSQAFLGQAHSDAGVAIAETANDYQIPRSFFYEALAAIESNLMREQLNKPNDLLRFAYRQNATFLMSVAQVCDLGDKPNRDYFLCLGIGTGLLDVLLDWPHWEQSNWLPIPQDWLPATWGARRLYEPDWQKPLRLTASGRRRYFPSVWRQIATLGIETLAQARVPAAVANSPWADVFAQWSGESLNRLHSLFDRPQQLL